MKSLKVNILVLGIFLAMVGSVRAMEGTAVLSSNEDQTGSCFTASVFYEGRYRVLLTCRGLKSALDPVRNKYVVWAKNGENLKRMGEVVNGKMRTSMDQEFKELVITAERDSYINKPSGEILLKGTMESIKFDGTKAIEEITPVVEEQVEEIEEIDDRGAVIPEVKGESSVGGAFKVLGKALLTGFAVLIVVVGVLSYFSRRKK